MAVHGLLAISIAALMFSAFHIGREYERRRPGRAPASSDRREEAAPIRAVGLERVGIEDIAERAFLSGYACGTDHDPDGDGFEVEAAGAWECERSAILGRS